jgi:DNA-binding response OmpR family regulator
MKILVAEDDMYTREGLVSILETEGYEALSARNGDEALEAFRAKSPDIVCLDVMMPGRNGYDVCREIRRTHADIPVIFISAKSEEIDKVLGLELGADDFIVKPFGVKEVVARIRAVSRRYAQGRLKEEEIEPFRMLDLSVVPSELKAYRDRKPIDLSPRDIKLLCALYSNRGKVLDRNALFDAGWGVAHLPNSRTLDQHISQLRKKIELDPRHPKIIVTVHNAGYRYPG